MVRERRKGPRARQIEEERAAQAAHDTQQLFKWGGIGLILLAAALGIYGWRETKVSAGASALPVPADLAGIEASWSAPDPHLRIGKHLALYQASVFEYELERGEVEPAFLPGRTPINYCLYPVISETHPYHAAHEEWRKGVSAGTAGAEPDIREIAVLVKTERFPTVGTIADDPAWETSVQGLVVNRIRSLQPDESRLIRESIPSADLSRVLILEEGRTPTSGGGSMMVFLLAALSAAGGVTCLVVWKQKEGAGRRRRTSGSSRPAAPAPPEEPRPRRRPPGRRPRRGR